MPAALASRMKVAALLELTKPRITALVVFTTGAGLCLAPRQASLAVALITLGGTALAVAAANSLNMFLERDTDALMPRTRNRPLPSRRLEPGKALAFGLVLAGISVPLLSFGAGPIPGSLAAVALVSYVILYTPLKRRTSGALLVGAVAGAIPPLIGWTAATGRFDLPGLLLFAVLFLWQVPHFLAITLLRGGEYARAGLLVQPARGARRNIVVYTLAMIACSLMFVPLGVGGRAYLVVTIVSGGLFFAHGLQGLRRAPYRGWARNEFLGSIGYLTVLLTVLLFDGSHL